MAAIPVTITGMMAYTDLQVGGGPVLPSPGVPAHPIYLPPTSPGVPTHPIYLPPTSEGPPAYPAHPIYNPAYPSHPIYYPPPPQPEGPPSGEGRWGWVDPPGVWVWVPSEPGKPQPPGT